MVKNLDVSNFRNGDPIKRARSLDQWVKAAENSEPGWCYYNDNGIYGSKVGKFYNFYAVSDLRGLAPYGWKVPSSNDWEELFSAVDGKANAGT